MTIGIYSLVFSDGSTYVGQSINLSKRTARHLYDLQRLSHPNYKVQLTYNKLGNPQVIILSECDISELCAQEAYFAKEVPTHLLLNISEVGQNSTSLPGELNGRAKFSNAQVLDAVELMCSGLPKKEVADLTGISYSMVRQIASGTSHKWLQNAVPDLYAKMLSKVRKAYTVKVVSPLGIVFEVSNQAKFCRDNGIQYRENFNKLILQKEHILSVEGWTKYTGE